MLPIPVGVAPQLHLIREDAREIKESPHVFFCNVPSTEYEVDGKFP